MNTNEPQPTTLPFDLQVELSRIVEDLCLYLTPPIGASLVQSLVLPRRRFLAMKAFVDTYEKELLVPIQIGDFVAADVDKEVYDYFRDILLEALETYKKESTGGR